MERKRLADYLDSHPELDEGSRIGFEQIRKGDFVLISRDNPPTGTIRRKISKEEIRELIGDPEKLSKELAEFTKKMKKEGHDPHPDEPFFG